MANFVKDILELTAEMKNDIKSLSATSNFFRVLGNPTKLRIIAVLLHNSKSKIDLSKSDIHSVLSVFGYKISNKNVFIALEQLKKDKIIFFKRKRGPKNAVYVGLNKEVAQEHINELKRSLEVIGGLIKDY